MPRFQIKWKGYEKKSDLTWEPEENLTYEIFYQSILSCSANFDILTGQHRRSLMGITKRLAVGRLYFLMLNNWGKKKSHLNPRRDLGSRKRQPRPPMAKEEEKAQPIRIRQVLLPALKGSHSNRPLVHGKIWFRILMPVRVMMEKLWFFFSGQTVKKPSTH